MTKALAPFAFLAFSLGLIFLYIRPAFGVLEAFQNQDDRVDSALAMSTKLKDKTKELVALHEKYERDGVSLRRLATALPDTFDVAQFVINLDSLAFTHDVLINAFQFEKPKKTMTNPYAEDGVVEASKNIVGEGVVEVRATGKYENIKSFIENIERSLNLYDVQEISISREGDGGSRGGVVPVEVTEDGLEVSLTVKTYWLK